VIALLLLIISFQLREPSYAYDIREYDSVGAAGLGMYKDSKQGYEFIDMVFHKPDASGDPGSVFVLYRSVPHSLSGFYD